MFVLFLCLPQKKALLPEYFKDKGYTLRSFISYFQIQRNGQIVTWADYIGVASIFPLQARRSESVPAREIWKLRRCRVNSLF